MQNKLNIPIYTYILYVLIFCVPLAGFITHFLQRNIILQNTFYTTVIAAGLIYLQIYLTTQSTDRFKLWAIHGLRVDRIISVFDFNLEPEDEEVRPLLGWLFWYKIKKSYAKIVRYEKDNNENKLALIYCYGVGDSRSDIHRMHVLPDIVEMGMLTDYIHNLKYFKKTRESDESIISGIQFLNN